VFGLTLPYDINMIKKDGNKLKLI